MRRADSVPEGRRTWRRSAVFVAVAVATLGVGCVPAAAQASPRASPAPVAPLATDDSLAEAVAVVRRQAMFLDDRAEIDRGEVDTTAKLKAWLTRHDFYSDFLTQAENARLDATRKSRYVGIGLELAKNASGDVVCYPLVAGPAERAGIRAGDQLVSIAGSSVRGKSLPTLVAAAGGGLRAELALEVVDAEGRHRRVAVRRSEIDAPATTQQRHDGLSVIRLTAFTADTRNEVELLVGGLKRGDAIVIDLRGNAGGDFHAAVDTAMLFLRRGQPIVSVRSRSGSKRYDATVDRAHDERPVVLWQDGATASAAEVFIAALTGNHRARSIGVKSFGKGTRQDIIELKSGDTLILTTGYLRSPDGIEFDGRGLVPDIALASGARTADYLAQTLAVIRPAPRGRRAAALSIPASTPGETT